MFRDDGTHYRTEHELAVSSEQPGHKIVTDLENRPGGAMYSIFEFVSDPVPVVGAEHRRGRAAVQSQCATIKDVAGQLATAPAARCRIWAVG